MPSNLPPRVSREIFARKLWRNPSQLHQVRSRSTAQPIKFWEEDAGASTFLYNGNLSHGVTGKQSPAQTPPVSPKKSPRQASRVDINRQARTTPAVHSIPQQDNDSSPLSQDENCIRDHIAFPTQKDYPHIHPSVFTDPKGLILQALQGKADIKTQFTEPRLQGKTPPSYQCTLTCVSRKSDDSDVGVGHGPDKVGLADRLMNSLTMPRNPPRGLPINIWSIGFTRMGRFGTSSRTKRARIKASRS